MGAEWEKTEEQKCFLQSKLPGFRDAQADGKGSAFILSVIEEWFQNWPERDSLFGPPGLNDPILTEEEKAERKKRVALAVEKRRKQITTYIPWHADSFNVAGGRASRAKSDPVVKLLKADPKRRKKQPAQVFAQIFKDKVDDELRRSMPPSSAIGVTDIKAYQGKRMSLRNKLIYRMWQEADEKTRQTVYETKEKMDKDMGFVDSDEEKRMVTEEQESVQSEVHFGERVSRDSITRADMQKNIKSLGRVAVSILKQLAKKTGWSFTILMGGLNEEGRPDLASVNVGTTPTTGLNFAEYIVDFDTRILQPFREFLSVVYPPDLRQEYAVEYAKNFAERVNKSANQMEGIVMGTNSDGMEIDAATPPLSTAAPFQPPAASQPGPSFTQSAQIPETLFNFNGIDLDVMNFDSPFNWNHASQGNDLAILHSFMAATEGANLNFNLPSCNDMDGTRPEAIPNSLGLNYQMPVGNGRSDNVELLSNGIPTFKFPSGGDPARSYFGDMSLQPPALQAQLAAGLPGYSSGNEFQTLASDTDIPMMTTSGYPFVRAGDPGDSQHQMGNFQIRTTDTPTMTLPVDTTSPCVDSDVPMSPDIPVTSTVTGDLGSSTTVPTASGDPPLPASIMNTGTTSSGDGPMRLQLGATRNSKGRKPIKKAKAQRKVSMSIGGSQVSTGLVEVEGNVNALGRPIRERKKKVPMGAAYEREVEKWAKRSRK